MNTSVGYIHVLD